MKKISAFLIIFFLWYILSPLVSFIKYEKSYSYNHEEVAQNLHFQNEYAETSSLKDIIKIKKDITATNSHTFETNKNVFILKIPKTLAFEELSKINISFTSGEKTYQAEMDVDGDERILLDDSFYSKPLFIDSTKRISYKISTSLDPKLIQNITLVGLDTESFTEQIAFEPTFTQSANAQDSLNIMSRKDWWANEEYRYEDSAAWKKILAVQEANKDKPKSVATIAYEKKVSDINNYLATNFPQKEVPVETIKNENGRSLVWNIQKTKTVDKIVIHHSAEDNETGKDDLTLIRGIYYYHAIVRGWGDIGYNYIIGQRGQIYEGRAGGDYVAGAHALWNNKSSVGVSIMGNFQTDHLVGEQETALKNIIEFLSKKYGIDVQKTSVGHRECPSNGSQPCTLLQDYQTYNLLWHKEVGYTSCPGSNLVSILWDVRKNATYAVGLVAVENPKAKIISPEVSAVIAQNTTLNKWPIVKIKLSYPTDSIRVKSFTTEPMTIALGDRARALKQGIELRFEPYGTNQILLWLGNKKLRLPEIRLSSSILEVPGWDRTPTWDKNKTYNDNKFRGTLWVSNENGRLLVVNELPLENYLKWLAEISNTDNVEKIKTILVAARSYANWYIDPANRKFPGKPYDWSDDPDVFQKYLGYGYEQRSPMISKLVDETNGIIIQYKGNKIKPWYFNQSDGQTLSYKQYCELNKKTGCDDIPYLQSVTDPAGNLGRKGHGVGISGAGATFLATQMDWKYDQIIKYFLDGTEVKKIY